MNYKSRLNSLNIYDDVLFSMIEIEQAIKETLYTNTSQEWSIRNKVTYDNKSKIVRIEYYIIKKHVPNIIRHTFKIGKIKYIVREQNHEDIKGKEYNIYFPTKFQKEAYIGMESWFNKLLYGGFIFPLGTKEIKVQNQKEAYMYLYTDYQTEDNYLSALKNFFDYPEEFDYITDSIIGLAEEKKRKQQKRLTK